MLLPNELVILISFLAADVTRRCGGGSEAWKIRVDLHDGFKGECAERVEVSKREFIGTSVRDGELVIRKTMKLTGRVCRDSRKSSAECPKFVIF
ncbi:hypothetical protein U1Q18_045912 [Sarracenia purpurea var. burkii]